MISSAGTPSSAWSNATSASRRSVPQERELRSSKSIQRTGIRLACHYWARVTKESALRRNELVAALADEVFIAHITPGGQTEDLARMLKGWRLPVHGPEN